MGYPDSNPGGAGYLLARLLGVAGLLAVLGGAGLGFYHFMTRPTAGSLKKLSVPGKTEVVLEEPGTYNLYHDFTWKGRLEDLRLAVRSRRTGQDIPVNDTSASPESTWKEPDRHKRFASFVAEEPGAYEVATSHASRGTAAGNIFVGKNYEPDFVTPLAGVAGGIVLIITGLILASAVFSSRARAAEAAGQSLLYREKGIRVYTDVILLKKKFSGAEIHKSQVNYIQQITKHTKGHYSKTSSSGPRTLQGIKINYTRGGREHEKTFWSEAYSKLYQAVKGAGYSTRWEPPRPGAG